jgi:hypothetical protein
VRSGITSGWVAGTEAGALGILVNGTRLVG